MSKSLFGSVEQQFTDSVSGFFRGFGYDNRSAYDGYDHYGATGIDGRPDTRQVYSQNWDTGLRYNRGIFQSQLVAGYGRSKDQNYDPKKAATLTPQPWMT